LTFWLKYAIFENKNQIEVLISQNQGTVVSRKQVSPLEIIHVKEIKNDN